METMTFREKKIPANDSEGRTTKSEDDILFSLVLHYVGTGYSISISEVNLLPMPEQVRFYHVRIEKERGFY